MNDLATVTILVDIRTGETLPATPENAAWVLQEIAEEQRRLAVFRRACVDVLREHSERQGTKTLHIDGRTVTISGGPRDDYNTDALAANLEAAGCPGDRITDALGKPTYKPNRRVLTQLAAANTAYAAAIAGSVVRVDESWRASVKL